MTIDDLNAVLARYPASVRPLVLPESLGNAGGNSGALLWRFGSGRGTLVARAWPPDGPSREALRRIHGWLEAAAGLGFVSVPERDRDGESIQERAGRLWEVSPWLSGIAARGRPPARDRLRAAFVALATFHQVLGRESRLGRSPGLGSRSQELEALLRGGFQELEAAVEGGEDDSCRDAARRWIELARLEATRRIVPLRRASARECRIQPCLRDVRPEHFLFQEGRVTGLVDFGAMGLDVVACDLARLLAEWVEGDRLARAEALEAYDSIRPLDRTESELIDAFEASAAVLGAGHWIRWHFVERRAFGDPDAVAAGIARGLDRLARSVASQGH